MKRSLATLKMLFFWAFLVCLQTVVGAMPPGSITGKVFTDFNLNGLDDEMGPGLAGVSVRVYGPAGLVTTVTTNTMGVWSATGLTHGTKYRVEYQLPAALSHYSSSMKGTNACTTVQFVTSPLDNVNQGFSAHENYCQADPFSITPCYISGDPLLGGTANIDALVAVPYTASGTGQTANTYLAKSAAIGSTYGTAIQRNTKIMFTSAVLKRHAGFGPGGTGAIYVRNLTNINAPVDLGWFSLDSLGINTGTDPRIGNPLPANKEDPSYDSLAWPLVGKMSLGDMETSADGKYLYVVNLFDKTLYRVFIDNPYRKPSAADVTAIPFVNPGCPGGTGDWAPWALEIYNGEVYGGVVCTGQTANDSTQLRAHVVKLMGGTWTNVINFPLTFERGQIKIPDPINNWYAWNDDPAISFDLSEFAFIHPQPILSDIEFDVDGSMILGFADRMGLQGGYRNYGPTLLYTGTFTTFSGGDILRVCNIGGSYVLEGSGTGCQTAIGATQMEGPNGKEFYHSDFFGFPLNDPMATRIHSETALGPLALIAGKGEVLASIFDPFNFNTNGITYFNNTDGTRSHSYEVFDTTSGFFGKAIGLGATEFLCDAAPNQKGNYVWKDTDQDGIQDPNEAPLAGVTMELVDKRCQVVATATTNAAGEYYFNTGLQLDSTYQIVVGRSAGQWNPASMFLRDTLKLTVMNIGVGPQPDINDSDGVLGGVCFATYPSATFTVDTFGYVNHSCDFGFLVQACDIDITATAITNEVCAGNNNGQVVATATSTLGAITYSINGGTPSASATFTNLAPGNYTIRATLTSDATCFVDTAIVIAPGLIVGTVTAPMPGQMCEDLAAATATPISATPFPCPAGTGSALIRWYAAATGGAALGNGNTFNPVALGVITSATPGTYTYYAESSCATCVSVRVPIVFTIHPTPTPVIMGDSLPCPGETVTYTTALNAGSTYAWQLVGPGTIISTIANMFTVKMPDSTATTQIVVTETSQFGCVGTDSLTACTRIIALTCSNNAQISLGNNCCVKIHPDQILEGDHKSYNDFVITITTLTGIPVPGDSICGKGDFIVKVTEPCFGNSCWGRVKAEDKLPPVINCQPVSYPCSYTDMSVVIPNLSSMPVFVQPGGGIGAVVINDNCGLAAISYTDDYVKYSCDTLFGVVAGRLFRTWFATDMSGNTSSCQQVITYLRQTGNIQWPTDTVVSCVGPNVHPSNTGWPLIAGIPANFNTHGFCDLGITYVDNVQPICTGTKKIIRTWTLVDWCQPLSATNPRNHVQLITVMDSTPPVFMCPADYTVSTETTSCTALVNLPDVIASDACSRIASGKAIAPSANLTATISNFPGNNLWAPDTLVAFGSLQNLPLGDHPIKYIITDDCGNQAQCTFKVIVLDAVPPIAACEAHTKVSLNSNGMALIQAWTFDDGSTDNCAPVHFKARRMNTSACVPTGYENFDDQVKFCCSDIGDSVLVVLRVYDTQPFSGSVSASHLEDHANECMVRVIVEDKVRPNIVCPANVTVNCNNFDPSLWAHGQATATDNCGLDTITSSVNYAQFDTICDNGIIRRTFAATDNFGNVMTCTQRIQVNRLLGFNVKWPDDLTVTQCNALPNAAKPIIGNVVCGIPGVSYTDEKINIVPDACYKIIRKWRIQDLCEDVTNYTPTLINNPNATHIGPSTAADAYNHGYFEYNQVIKVVDSEKPVIANCPDTVLVINDYTNNDPTLYYGPDYWDAAHNSHDLCEAPAPLSIRATDACSKSDLKVEFTLALDLNNDGVMETTILSGAIGAPVLVFTPDSTHLTATFHPSFQLPHGRHKIKWRVSDGCGNETTCEYTFVVRDAKAPTIVCLNGLAVNIMPSGMIEMWASDFLQYGSDNCTPSGLLEYGVRESTAAGTGFPTTLNVLFDCNDLGTKLVKLYARDKAGNFDYCETYILVQDNAGICTTTKVTIAGALKTEAAKPVDNTQVLISGQSNALPNPSMFTNSTGLYSFNAVPIGDNYVISAKRGGNWLNGVNMLDVLKIQRHILGLEPLSTPYKQIAADANRSGSVTSADMVTMRKLILGALDSIPGNTSWRFVDKKHQFANANNPFTAAIPELISIANLQLQLSDGDFMSVKTGDVTGDAVPNAQDVAGDRGPATKTVTLDAGRDRKFAVGETITVTLTADQMHQMQACQFTLRFDANTLTFSDLATGAGLDASNYSLLHINDGFITFAHNSNDVMTAGQELLTLTFVATKAGNTATALSLSNAVTPIAAFDNDGTEYDVQLRFGAGSTATVTAWEVFQNTPNPFSEKTIIGVSLPEASEVVLTIFDGTGRTLHTVRKDLQKGLHNFDILSGHLPVQGLLYYRVESAFGNIERKMIHVNR